VPAELDRICKFLEVGTPELQAAAALVLGALQPREPGVRKALVKAMRRSEETVRLRCVEALARIDPAEALPHVVPLLSGPEPVRARLAEVLSSLGPAAAKALRGHLAKADPEGRAAILEVLGQIREVDASDALLTGLADSDPEVVRRAAQAYARRAEGLSPEERGRALRKVLEFMKSPKAKGALASCLEVVSAFKDAAAARAVLPYVERKQSPEVRAQALAALAGMPLEGGVARAVAAKALPLLEGGEAVGAVLEILGSIPMGREHADRLLRLLRSPQPQVRVFAVRALGGAGTAPAAEAVAAALLGPDPGIAEAAAASFRSNPAYVPYLVKALERQEDRANAWKIANVLRSYGSALDKATVKTLLSRCLAQMDDKEGAAQVTFEVVRAAAPAALREAVLRKGREILARGDAAGAERRLKLLAGDDIATSESDLALAAAQLRLQRKDLAAAGRDQGRAVMLFLKLSRREGFDLLKALQKESRLLPPDDLLYLGFALAERQGSDRDAGAGILKLVVRRFGAKPQAKTARQKLKTQGLG
jgi:HEAT repeat protein